jgi:phosphoribosylformylglycinamidine synthase
VFYQFSSAVKGIGDACRALRLTDDDDKGVPVVSGNVSFYNQSETGDAIAPTPIVSCVGRIDDASTARNMAFKQTGSTVVLLGNLHDRLGGSEFERYFGTAASEETPEPDFRSEVAVLRGLLDGFRDGMVLAAHDISHGGILVALAEMVLTSRPCGVGCDVDFTMFKSSRETGTDSLLFGEYGGIVAEVAADGWSRFETTIRKYGAPFHRLGKTREGGGLRVETGNGVLELGPDQLEEAFKGGVAELLV